MTSKVLIALYFGLLAASAGAATPGKKGYTVTDLKTVVSNGNHCDNLLGDLNEMFKQPIAIHFESKGGTLHHGEHDNKDVTEHHNIRAQQHIVGNTVHRTATGHFVLKGQKIFYVAEITANLDNPTHQYVYPVILTSADVNCQYTALIRPDEATIKAFKDGIASGAVKKGTDLDQ